MDSKEIKVTISYEDYKYLASINESEDSTGIIEHICNLYLDKQGE